MHPITIDLRANPDLQFRIDAFSVPTAARAEFDASLHRNLAFIETLQGFQGHVVRRVRLKNPKRQLPKRRMRPRKKW